MNGTHGLFYFMGKIKDIIGQKFNRLTAIELVGFDNGGRAKFLFKCECGNTKRIIGYSVIKGITKSCGCLHKEKSKEANTTHGLRRHPLYKVWVGMRERCYVSTNKRYSNYGGRGVLVCKEWKDDFNTFYTWAIGNGYKVGLQLDKDKNGTGLLYCPEYCCFISNKENSSMRSHLKLSKNTVREIKETFSNLIQEFAIKYDSNPTTIYNVLKLKTWLD
jgi:hypothetical protein